MMKRSGRAAVNSGQCNVLAHCLTLDVFRIFIVCLSVGGARSPVSILVTFVTAITEARQPRRRWVF